MLCPLTASLTAFYTGFVNVQLLFEAIHVLFNGRNGDRLLHGMVTECFGALLVIGVVKMLVWMLHKWRKTQSYHQSRNSVLLGLLLIATSSIFGRIFIPKILEDHKTTAFVFFIVNVFYFSYFLLVHYPAKNCCWSTKPVSRTYEVLLVLLVFTHGGIFIKSIIDATGQKNPQAFLIAQFCYSLLLASSTADILAILMGRLEESEEFQQNGCLIEVKDSGSSSAKKGEEFQQNGCLIEVKDSGSSSAKKGERFQQPGYVIEVKDSSEVLIPTRSIH